MVGIEMGRIVSWFSCGAASAVATKLSLLKYGKDLEIVYQDTGSEHPDNARFFKDCEDWFGHDIKVLKSDKYNDIWDVFEKTRWLVGPKGARCTTELKRKVAEDYIDFYETTEVFGFTCDEVSRVDLFIENNPERIIDPILLERGLCKEDCLAMIDNAGIELPVMYKLGYKNNNCIGCVKGQMGYWNKIRVDFPEVFDRMAKVERDIGAAINKSYAGDKKRKKVFLDELDPNAGHYLKEPSISCGIMCEGAIKDIEEEEENC